MSTEIYYFTGTGNSLMVATDLTKEIGAQLISIPSVIDKATITTPAQAIGVVFPVYIWGIPLIVEQFIKKVENLHDKYIFAVLTYGGTAGAAVKLFAKMIENRGGKLALGFKVHMPGNYTPLYGAIDEKKQQRLFSDWQQRLPAIAKAITSRRRGINENDNPLFNFIFSEIIYHSAAPHFSTMDKNFWTDAKCNHCGTTRSARWEISSGLTPNPPGKAAASNVSPA